MKFDCFLFFNEFELLKIRLQEVHDSVDVIVLVESRWTYRGEPKEPRFSARKQEFERFLPKIRHVIVEDWPADRSPVGLEQHLKAAIMRGLPDLKDSDSVVISDLDEIPRRTTWQRFEYFRSAFRKDIVSLHMQCYFSHLNTRDRVDWFYAKIATGKKVKELGSRGIRYSGLSELSIMPDAGWHFTYMGSRDEKVEKILTSVYEGDIQPLVHGLREGKELEHLWQRADVGAITSGHPVCVTDNLDYYRSIGYIL